MSVSDAPARYVAAYRRFAANGAGAAPRWLAEIREAAIQRFADLGFPTTREEAWRFTSVGPLAETRFVLASAEAARAPSARAIAPLRLGAGRRHTAVFVNGAFDEGLSSLDDLPRGVRVESLGAALAGDPDFLREYLARHVRADGGAFSALNTAFLRDGAFVFVPPGTELAEPIQLLFVSAAAAQPAVCHPRNLVVVGRLARATIVEDYAAVHGGVYWTNAVTELCVGDGARADVYRLQREGERAYHVATTHTQQGRDSVVWLHPLAFGASLSRHDIVAVLDGEGAFCALNGLYLVAGDQHVDHHTVIDHAKPHCESHEYMNGVLAQRSRGVFNGRIIVRPGAQRTDSKQTNNNLLLSEQARADSQPQLEIYADDVKCTHGATLGPLDRNAMFYLLSRGLSEEAARGLLTYGFGAEILGRMEHPVLRGQLDLLVRERLHTDQRSGVAS